MKHSSFDKANVIQRIYDSIVLFEVVKFYGIVPLPTFVQWSLHDVNTPWYTVHGNKVGFAPISWAFICTCCERNLYLWRMSFQWIKKKKWRNKWINAQISANRDLLQSVVSVHVMALHFFDASLTDGTDSMNSFIFIYIDHLFWKICESSSHYSSSSVHLFVCFRCPNNFVRKIFTFAKCCQVFEAEACCLFRKKRFYLSEYSRKVPTSHVFVMEIVNIKGISDKGSNIFSTFYFLNSECILRKGEKNHNEQHNRVSLNTFQIPLLF